MLRSAIASLHQHGAAHGIDHRRKLDEEAVAGGLHNAALVLRQSRVDKLAPQRLESSVRTFLVRAHEARIANNIGAEDRCQSPLDPICHHKDLPHERAA